MQSQVPGQEIRDSVREQCAPQKTVGAGRAPQISHAPCDLGGVRIDLRSRQGSPHGSPDGQCEFRCWTFNELRCMRGLVVLRLLRSWDIANMSFGVWISEARGEVPTDLPTARCTDRADQNPGFQNQGIYVYVHMYIYIYIYTYIYT